MRREEDPGCEALCSLEYQTMDDIKKLIHPEERSSQKLERGGLSRNVSNIFV
jgi:hypothetical protein